MARMLGKLQKTSVQHIDDLVARRVPTMPPKDLEGTLRGWAEDDLFARGLGAVMPCFV